MKGGKITYTRKMEQCKYITRIKLKVGWSFFQYLFFYSWDTFFLYCRQDPGKRILWELVTLSEVALKESYRKLCRRFLRELKRLNTRLIFSSKFHLSRCGDIYAHLEPEVMVKGLGSQSDSSTSISSELCYYSCRVFCPLDRILFTLSLRSGFMLDLGTGYRWKRLLNVVIPLPDSCVAHMTLCFCSRRCYLTFCSNLLSDDVLFAASSSKLQFQYEEGLCFNVVLKFLVVYV